MAPSEKMDKYQDKEIALSQFLKSLLSISVSLLFFKMLISLLSNTILMFPFVYITGF